MRLILRWLIDPSFWLLLVANVWPMWLVSTGALTPVEVYWSYVGQSLVILFLWTGRLWASGYGKKGTGDLLGVTVQVTTLSGKRKNEHDYSAAGIFLSMWLLLWALYTPFLLVIAGVPDFALVSWPLLGFAGAHVWSAVQYRGAVDPARVTMQYGQRILPMHLALLVGPFFPGVGAAFAFMALKTLSDIGGHVLDHRGDVR